MTKLLRRLEQRSCAAGNGEVSCSLAELGADCPARIVGFNCDDAIARRLFDLGFAPGQTARLVRRAPLRDPIMFNVGGTDIVLRRAEADRILVAIP